MLGPLINAFQESQDSLNLSHWQPTYAHKLTCICTSDRICMHTHTHTEVSERFCSFYLSNTIISKCEVSIFLSENERMWFPLKGTESTQTVRFMVLLAFLTKAVRESRTGHIDCWILLCSLVVQTLSFPGSRDTNGYISITCDLWSYKRHYQCNCTQHMAKLQNKTILWPSLIWLVLLKNKTQMLGQIWMCVITNNTAEVNYLTHPHCASSMDHNFWTRVSTCH